jgi:hypothetical protein
MKMAVLKRRVNEKIAIGLLLAVSMSRTWCIVFGLPWWHPFYIFVLPKPTNLFSQRIYYYFQFYGFSYKWNKNGM